MRRRDFISLIGGAAATWSLTVRAQQAAMPVIGILSNPSRNALPAAFASFHSGLKDAGYVEGQNVAIEYRFADGQVDRLPELAADLVNRKVDVLVAMANSAALVAKAVTTTIPVVFVIGGDPVKLGLVESLNRPGGNITGVSFFLTQLESKRLGSLHELVPRATEIAVLINPTQPAASDQVNEVKEAARALGLNAHIVHAASESDLEPAFATCAQLRAGGLLVTSDPFFNVVNKQIIALAARNAIPAIYEFREYVAIGGLASYGSPPTEAFHQAGVYAGNILGGAKVADLPAVQATKFELAINLKTAKLLGLEVPPSLSARADYVIE
jgi:putative tryptophan/tyrosine transport system substrate-binding protein